MKNPICYLTVALALSACHQSDVIEKIETIKTIGDTTPEIALSMADSLQLIIEEQNEYVHMKYHLLRVRLNDKADNLATNDLLIRELVPYFENNGTDKEKQEVYYYAGSVYRDLKDTPRALEYFLKSTEQTRNIDSVLLRNSYSQLNGLYFDVHDCANALKYAQKLIKIEKERNNTNAISYTQAAYAYLGVDSIEKAKGYLDKSLNILMKTHATNRKAEQIEPLLYAYSYLKEEQKADTCFLLLSQSTHEEKYKQDKTITAEYYKLKKDYQKAIDCYTKTLSSNSPLTIQSDAARNLFMLYYHNNEYLKAAELAQRFVQISDTLDLGKRQEDAATVNNLYQYHRDRERELRLHDEVDQYRYRIILMAFTFLLLFLAFLTFYYRKRSHHLREQLKNAVILQDIKNENKILEHELVKANENLNDNKEKLKQAQERIERMDEELLTSTIQLQEKQQQNSLLKHLFHQKKLSEESKEILQNIRKAAMGQHHLTTEEWSTLYAAVDHLHPSFQEDLFNNLGSFDEQQMRVYYLLRIGLSCATIQNVVSTSRSSVYRWASTYRKQFKENYPTDESIDADEQESLLPKS